MTADGASALTQIARGFVLPFRSARILLTHRRLLPYAALPLAVNLVLGCALVYALFAWFLPWLHVDGWKDTVIAWFPTWFPTMMAQAVGTVAGWLAWCGAVLISLAFLYIGFSALGQTIASPFNDILSEKTEVVLTGCGDPALPWAMYLRETLRTFLGSLRTLGWQILVTVALLPFSWIPVLGAIMLALANAYFVGRGFLDIPCARHFMHKAHRHAGYTGRHWMLVGLGLGMLMFMLIPGGALIFLPLGVVSGTLFYTEIAWNTCFSAQKLTPPPGFPASPA